jgi:hypothetical protein
MLSHLPYVHVYIKQCFVSGCGAGLDTASRGLVDRAVSSQKGFPHSINEHRNEGNGFCFLIFILHHKSVTSVFISTNLVNPTENNIMFEELGCFL